MYASDRLADRNFKSMTAAERGLLHTIELELWVNGAVPADTRELARVIGMDYCEVETAFTGRVQKFLERREVPDAVWVSPELEEYRGRLEARHEKQAGGGREGARRRWGNKEGNGSPDGTPSSQPTGHPNESLSREEKNGEEQNRKPVYKGDGHDDFRSEMEGPAPFEGAGAQKRVSQLG